MSVCDVCQGLMFHIYHKSGSGLLDLLLVPVGIHHPKVNQCPVSGVVLIFMFWAMRIICVALSTQSSQKYLPTQ